MLLRKTPTFRPLLALSTLAGLRSISPLVVLSYALTRRPLPNQSWVVQRFGTKKTATIFGILALGELVGDKLPLTPARTSDTAFLGRLLTGSAVGALYSSAYKLPVLQSVLQGGIVAAFSTYASYYLRRILGPLLGLSEPIPGFVEDALVLVAGIWLLKELEETQPGETSRLPMSTDTL